MKSESFLAIIVVACMPIIGMAAPVPNSGKTVSVIQESSSDSIKENNLRIFPLKYFHGSAHFGYERAITNNFILGSEVSYMPNHQISYFYIHRPGERYRESFGGILGQYYFSRKFTGFYAEAGANYLQVSGRFGSPYGLTSEQEVNQGFLYPHLDLGYRVRMRAGFNFGIGLGAGIYIGETLYIPNSTVESPFYSGRREARLRFDFGYGF